MSQTFLTLGQTLSVVFKVFNGPPEDGFIYYMVRDICPMYDHIRDTYFPQITQIHKKIENQHDFDKLSYLLGEIPQCAITAAIFVT